MLMLTTRDKKTRFKNDDCALAHKGRTLNNILFSSISVERKKNLFLLQTTPEWAKNEFSPILNNILKFCCRLLKELNSFNEWAKNEFFQSFISSSFFFRSFFLIFRNSSELLFSLRKKLSNPSLHPLLLPTQ